MSASRAVSASPACDGRVVDRTEKGVDSLRQISTDAIRKPRADRVFEGAGCCDPELHRFYPFA